MVVALAAVPAANVAINEAQAVQAWGIGKVQADFSITTILVAVAVAVAMLIARLVYGAILTGRDYEQSDQSWANAHKRVILNAVRPGAR
jgi:hypothetical protein